MLRLFFTFSPFNRRRRHTLSLQTLNSVPALLFLARRQEKYRRGASRDKAEGAALLPHFRGFALLPLLPTRRAESIRRRSTCTRSSSTLPVFRPGVKRCACCLVVVVVGGRGDKRVAAAAKNWDEDKIGPATGGIHLMKRATKFTRSNQRDNK